MKNQSIWCMAALAGTAVLLCLTESASAIIIHPEDDPPNALSTPLDAVVGRWGNNASAVAVSPNHVITTRHQGGGVGTNVIIDGTTYKVVEVVIEPGGADLRVARIETLGGDPANLTNYVGIYDLTDEALQSVVIGGFGEGRGADVIAGPGPNAGLTIGYEWDGVKGTQRWGANLVDSTASNQNFDIYTNDTLVADFDDPTLGVFAEASLAAGDSGGGWFINDGGVWKVAALSQGVESETSPNPDPAFFIPPESMSGVRLSSYSSFIISNVPEPGSGLLLFAAIGACVMRRRRA